EMVLLGNDLCPSIMHDSGDLPLALDDFLAITPVETTRAGIGSGMHKTIAGNNQTDTALGALPLIKDFAPVGKALGITKHLCMRGLHDAVTNFNISDFKGTEQAWIIW